MKSNNGEETNRFREITIPGDVLDDERLSDGAKLMYGKIARLAFKTGECWASNSFLDGTKTGRNSSRFIAELKNAGYIVIENEGSKFRKIKICPIKSTVDDSTSPHLAGSHMDNLANSGGVNNNPTPPILAGLNSPPRQIRRGNLANSGDVHLANSGDRTLQDSTNLNLTSSSAPESHTQSPPYEEEEAVPLSLPKLKDTLAAVDPCLILSDDFYPRAAAFLTANGLDLPYLPWMYEQCTLQNPRSIRGLYYTLFFDNSMPEVYKASIQTAAPPTPPPDMPCPACGTFHAQTDDACPSCGLPKDAPAYRIRLLRQLHEFPPEKRAEYLRREQDIGNECGLKDFVKHEALLAGLQKEFGLETA